MSGVEVSLVNHYVGEVVSEEQLGDEETPSVDKEVQSIGDERQAEYEEHLAEIENKDLPTKEEITDFIAGIPVSNNYINTVFNAVKDKHPAWNCDTWVDKNGNQIISLYYVDPYSSKGYDSIYFNEFGKEISMSGVEVSLVNHYVGEVGSEEQLVDEETQSVETNFRLINGEQVTEYDEQLAEYEEQLAEYEKRLDEYEEKQSVGYELQTKYTAQSIDGEDQSAEYKELLAEYKELLDEYQEVNADGSVTPPTEPEETTRKREIRDGILVAVVGTVVGGFILSKLHWN